jgi:hypothetical protein
VSVGYQIFAIGQAGLVLLVPAAVSLGYYFSSRTHYHRLLWSGHGVILLLAFAYAIAISPWSANGNWTFAVWPYWVLLGLFVVSVIYSLIWFQGHRAVHLLQLVLLPSAVWIWFIGTMTITHDWI